MTCYLTLTGRRKVQGKYFLILFAFSVAVKALPKSSLKFDVDVLFLEVLPGFNDQSEHSSKVLFGVPAHKLLEVAPDPFDT